MCTVFGMDLWSKLNHAVGTPMSRCLHLHAATALDAVTFFVRDHCCNSRFTDKLLSWFLYATVPSCQIVPSFATSGGGQMTQLLLPSYVISSGNDGLRGQEAICNSLPARK